LIRSFVLVIRPQLLRYRRVSISNLQRPAHVTCHTCFCSWKIFFLSDSISSCKGSRENRTEINFLHENLQHHSICMHCCEIIFPLSLFNTPHHLEATNLITQILVGLLKCAINPAQTVTYVWTRTACHISYTMASSRCCITEFNSTRRLQLCICNSSCDNYSPTQPFKLHWMFKNEKAISWRHENKPEELLVGLKIAPEIHHICVPTELSSHSGLKS
jgi:hypothetical protein